MATLKLISLGCSKNTVDSEVVLAHVLPAHWTLLPPDSAKHPDVLLINTCGFIGDAKQESIDMILRSCMLKGKGRIKKLYVMGCLAQRYGQELAAEIPEVDAWFGVREPEKVVAAIAGGETAGAVDFNPERRVLTTPGHYAYLKISEGCDRQCAFCAIPLIRGKHKSRPMESLIKEAEALVGQGVKELILVAQDVTYYGLDLYGRQCIADLVQALARIEGVRWIRLQYLYPHSFPEDLLRLMQTEPKLCAYIDIPLQHIATSVLHDMQRATDREKTMALLHKLKAALPEAVFRTTLIVGFPTETEAAFEELKDFVAGFRFDRLGVFTYSEEEGTPASAMQDIVSAGEKDRRADEIMRLQEDISLSLNEARVGKVFEVVIDREEGDYYIGRTRYDSPEVDDEVLIARADGKLQIGGFYDVRITEAEIHDLYGRVEQAC
ncbi:MAG: 30S ribosomal protein S12 methylthiotransferase RimO [Bacteroidales bacterium]|nr:30S ribosomal protein S12 methylthiotransferase RimO [Bacteroidales bacterium]